MKNSISSLVRPHLDKLAPYSSARDEFSGTAHVYLDANENPYGDMVGGNWNRYPDPHQKQLKAKLAELKGVQPAQIFLGNGSDEAIDLLIRAFCEPGQDKILTNVPTYGMYNVSAAINNVNIIEVLLTETFELRPKSILKSVEEHTKIIFICSPNNPSGNLIAEENIIEVLEGFDGLVVVDEAYIDYTKTESWTKKLDKYPNLVVLQTFSKAWGMAALRLGMAFASEEIISVLNSIKPPYNVNEFTQQEALRALEKHDKLQEKIEATLNERAALAKQLQSIATVEKVYPSEANFIMVKVGRATQLYHFLIEKGIVVRNRSRVILCDNCIRITVGTPSENKELLTALQNWANEN
jgi:histidinol-phosphate aminotransferase